MKRPGFILILFIIVNVLSYGHTPYTGSPTGSSWGYKSNICNPTTTVALKNQITMIYQASGDWYAMFRVRKYDDSSFSSPGTAELWDETTSSMINSIGYPAGAGSIDIGGNISYIQSGTHQFVVKVIPSSGCTNSLWTDKYYITYSNSPPIEPNPVQEPQSGYVGVSLTYIYQVIDPDGDDVNLHVVWGDGTPTWESGLVSSGSMLYPSHIYNSVGIYTISTRGFDEHGKEGPLRVFDVNISAPTVPPSPQNVTATATSTTTIRISWDSASGATRYKVTNKTTGIESGDIYTTSYDWTGLNPGQNYCFIVKACNTSGCSGESSQACATTQISCPIPSITSVSPSMVAAGSGAGSIYINGTNFSTTCEPGYPKAYIANVNQNNVSYVNSSQIRVDYSSINDVSGFQEVQVKNAANTTYWAIRSDLFRIVKVENVQPGSGSFPIGSIISVSWTCNAPSSESMIISLKRDACVDCSPGPDYQVLNSNTPNDGNEQVLIPAGITQESDWRVYVKSITTQAYGAGEHITITAPIFHKAFTVDSYWHSTAYPNHWLDTGIDVTSGQQLFILAWGEACLDAPLGCCGPDGDPGIGTINGCYYGSLVGKIGSNGSVFCLGANYQGTMPAAGRLFLGYNDSDYENNSGSFVVGIGECTGTRLNNPILNSPTEGAVNVGTPTGDNTMASVQFSWNLNNSSAVADSWLSVRNLSSNHIIFSQNVGSAQSYTLDLGLNTQYRWSVIAMPKNTSYCSSDGTNATFTTTGPMTGFQISGKVFDMDNTSGLQNVTIRIQGDGIDNSETLTAPDGSFTLGTQNPLAPASYTITPSMTGYTFYPTSRIVNIKSQDVTCVNFYIDNEVPVVTLTGPASGASVFGDIFFQGSACTKVTVGDHAGINTITVFVDGVQRAWGYLTVSDYNYSLEELTWHDGNGIVLDNWNEILPATGLADVQVAAVGCGGKVGYSPHILLALGVDLNVTITSDKLDNMPLLRDTEVTAEAGADGGTGSYTYHWILDEDYLCPTGCSENITFDVKIFTKYLNLVVEDSVGNIGTKRVQIFVDTPSVSGNPESLRQASAGYGVNVANGNFFMQRTDLTLPAVGLPIVFTRTYNSCRFFSSHDGPLGKGWTHSYDIRLKTSQYSPDIQVTWGDGREESWLWMYGVYRSSSMENFSKLQKSGDDFIITDKNQIKYYLVPDTPDSEYYHLSSIEDPQANRITLDYTDGKLTRILNNTSNRFITLGYVDGKLVSITDNAPDGGRTVSYSYHPNNKHLALATDLRGQTEEYQYIDMDDLGAIKDIYLLSDIIDKKQNTVLTNTYHYVSGGLVQTRYRCTSQTHGPDQTYSFNYVSDTETIVTNPLEQETRFSMDEAGRVTDIYNSVEISEDQVEIYQFSLRYDFSGSSLPSHGLPTGVISPQQNDIPNPAGVVMSYSDDGQGNLLNLWEPNPTGDGSSNGPNHRFEYITDTAINKNLIKAYIDPENNQYDFSYYPNSLLQTVTFPDPQLNASVTYTYNSNGQVLTMETTRDGNTQTVQYRYENDFLDLTQIITPMGHSTIIQYDEVGHITSVTDALGKVTSYTYDGDLVKEVTIPIAPGRDATTTYTYDNNGRLTDIQDPMGKHTVYEYDIIGRLIKETNAAGNVLRYEYDNLNRLYRKTFTNSALHPIQYNYDDAGYLQGIQNLDLAETMVTYTYDKNGNVKTEIDGLSRTKTYTYDNMDRLTRIDYDDGTYETFVYNSRSLVEHYTDRRGNITDYIYDSLGRLKMVYEPVEPGRKLTTEINYDTVGNIKEIIAPANRLIRFEYDNHNRLTKRIEDPNGAALDFSYTYYNNNRLHTYTADGLTATYDYYDCGWLKSIAYTGGTTIQLTYNDNGFLIGMTDGAGNTVYGRDDVGRMLSRTDPFGNTVGYHYDSIGRLDVLTYPGNKSVSYTYDAAHRMKTVTSWLGTMATYNYNAAGQLDSILNGNNTSTTFGYQSTTGRLNGITHKKSDNSVIASYQFTLDGNGNRVSSSEIQPLLPQIQPQNISYTYDVANRLQTVGDKTFNFNDRGVLTGITSPQGNYSFTFDILDRLTSLTGPDNLSASFVYDGQGNRLSQTVNSEVTRYVVDANKALPDVLMEVDTANTPQSYYIYGLGLIARLDAGGNNPKYYHFDGTGSTVALTDGTQAVTDAYAYDPFGNVTDQFGTTPNPFKYVGQFGVQTAPAGLQYMRARYYMPEIGRFLSRDKVWGTTIQSQSLNLFAYTQNNPIVNIDSSGFEIEYKGELTQEQYNELYEKYGETLSLKEYQINKNVENIENVVKYFSFIPLPELIGTNVSFAGVAGMINPLIPISATFIDATYNFVYYIVLPPINNWRNEIRSKAYQLFWERVSLIRHRNLLEFHIWDNYVEYFLENYNEIHSHELDKETYLRVHQDAIFRKICVIRSKSTHIFDLTEAKKTWKVYLDFTLSD